MPRRILFLYTEAAPYIMACLAQLALDQEVDVHMVRWPVNKEAPFIFGKALVTIHQREELDDDALLQLADDLAPDLIVASGWVDKGYLRVCRKHRARGIPTAMINDTAWRGDLRQWVAVVLARFWFRRTYSHSWVTGAKQSHYVRKLGLAQKNIRTGFYSADTPRFSALGKKLLAERNAHWPHRFICVARYISTKGHQYLCDAFAALCAEGSAGDWELWLVGTGELHEEVKSSRSGSHSKIRHLGFKQADEMEEVLAQCGIFVLPSLFEPWGVVVHEHACAGFPLLLSSNVGAAERFLMEGGNGSGFPAGDTDRLKLLMRRMVESSDDELRAMGVRSWELGNAWTPSDWARTAMSFFDATP